MKKLSIILIFIFLFSFSLVLAEHTERGYSDKSYLNDERGQFNTALDDVNVYATNLVDNPVEQPPLIYDYDNDGDLDIITTDQDRFIFYNDYDFIATDSLYVADNIKHYSLYEYNSNLYLVFTYDVVYYQDLSVYQWNGSEFVFFANHSNSGLGLESSFTCDSSSGYCLHFNYAQATAYGMTFKLDNPTTISVSGMIAPPVNNNICYPSIPDITFYNYGNDNTYEFYFSASTVHQTVGDVKVRLYEVTLNSTGEIDGNSDTLLKETDISVTNGLGCENNKVLYTSPLVMDINNELPHEIIMGMGVDTNEFKLYSYELDGDLIDDYPENLNADGVLMSNVIGGQFFDHNYGPVDFCVMGYLSDTDNVDLLCASEQIFEFLGFLNSREFLSDEGSSDFDISLSDGYENIIYTSQHSSVLVGTTDLNEILTPFGVARITSNDQLEYIYRNNIPNSIMFDSDFEQVGWADLILQSETALIYIDDLFDNSPAGIDSYCINPCIDEVWQTNTTIGVTVTGGDIENDRVRAKAILYENDAVLEPVSTAWSSYTSIGTPISLSLSATNETSSSTLVVYIEDEENIGENESISFVISVNDNSNVTYGSCQTCADDLYFGEVVTEEDIISSGDIGSPCDTNEDCDSGKCAFNFCSLKTALESCTSDQQCLSGNCIDSKCSKPSIAQSLNTAGEETFSARDIGSKTVVSVILLVLIALAIVFVARNVWGVILAFLIVVVGTFALTLAGWLTPFILIGVVLFLLVLVVLMIIIGGRG